MLQQWHRLQLWLGFNLWPQELPHAVSAGIKKSKVGCCFSARPHFLSRRRERLGAPGKSLAMLVERVSVHTRVLSPASLHVVFHTSEE